MVDLPRGVRETPDGSPVAFLVPYLDFSPVAFAVTEGPAHTLSYANAAFRRLQSAGDIVITRGPIGGAASTLDARRSTLDARRSTLDARRSTSDHCSTARGVKPKSCATSCSRR